MVANATVSAGRCRNICLSEPPIPHNDRIDDFAALHASMCNEVRLL